MKKTHLIEIIGLIISILIAVVIFLATKDNSTTNNNLGWFIGILSIWIFYSIVVLKIHMNEVKHNIENNINNNNELIKVFFDINDKFIQYGKEKIDNTIEDLKSIKNGIVPLTEQEYYDRIIDKSKELSNGDKVISVNSIDERRFIEDGRQKIYLVENISAINRNENIEFIRIFILDIDNLDINPNSKRLQAISEGQPRNDAIKESIERIKAIKENIDGKIKVYIVDIKKLRRNKQSLLTDGVLFHFKSRDEKLLYIDYKDDHNPLNVSKG